MRRLLRRVEFQPQAEVRSQLWGTLFPQLQFVPARLRLQALARAEEVVARKQERWVREQLVVAVRPPVMARARKGWENLCGVVLRGIRR